MPTNHIHQLLAVVIAAAASSCAWCSFALADSTLTVSQATGSDTGECQNSPCRTIGYALKQSSMIGGSNTVVVAAGYYDEDLSLPVGVVKIVGAGSGTDLATDTVITGTSGAATIETNGPSVVSLADLRVVNPPGDDENMVSAPLADASLTGVVLDQQASEGNPIDVLTGNVSFNEGTISIDDPFAAGYAINDRGGDISVNDATITVAGGGYGLNAIEGTITATSTAINLTNPSEWGFAINTLGTIDAENDTINVAGHGFGINAIGPINIDRATVNLTNPNSHAFGVDSASSIDATSLQASLMGEGGFAVSSSEDIELARSSVVLNNPISGGDAVNAEGAIAASDDQITVAGDGFGLIATATITLDSSNVTMSDAEARPSAANAGGDLTGKDDTITDLGGDSAVHSGGDLSLADSKVVQSQTSSGPPAVNANGQALLQNVQITAGQASALASRGTSTITNSTLSLAGGSTEPAVLVRDGEANGHTVLLRKSSVFDQASGEPAILATNTDLTLESSLVSGGTGIAYNVGSGDHRTLTVAASTIDAATTGVRDTNTNSLVASVDNDPASTATVNVEGSILLEPPVAERPSSTGNVTINCANSEIPDTSQPQAGTDGQINCASATNGNSYTPNVSDIFADPGQTYKLNPAWNGVDSVPPAAVTLAASPTDLAGEARVQNALHTCLAAMQDKGALELAGYPGTQPEPAIGLPDQIIAGRPVTLTATGTVGATVAWKDSNGASGDGQTFADTFPTPGSYTITLTASGGPGCHAIANRTITVKSPAVPTDPPPSATPSTAVLACHRARLTLTDVAIKGGRVELTGVAEPTLAGKRVKIVSQHQRVATATVSPDGSFKALAPLPPADIRATNKARYQARIGSIHSLDLKLMRRLVLEPPASTHGTVILEGQVLAPFTSPAAPILVWQENARCTRAALIAKTIPGPDGHYAISLPMPARARSAIYRLSTRVQATHTNPRSFATFSLTEAVKLK